MRLLLRSIVRGRLGGWFMGVCHTLAGLTGMNAVVFRVAVLCGLFFSPVYAVVVYAGLYLAIRTFDALFGPDGDEERLLEAPFDGGAAEPLRLTGEFAALERKLAYLEAEALSSDAITRARFRSAGL